MAWLVFGFCVMGWTQGERGAVQGYVSIEPFELRKEFVLRFDAVAEEMGLEKSAPISEQNRSKFEEAIGSFLTGKCPIQIDGRLAEMELDRVHFVRPDPEKGLVVDDRTSIPAEEALVGVVFATPLEKPPEQVEIRWEVFPSDGSEAVVEAGVRGQRSARKLTPENDVLLWENEGGLVVPELLALPSVPSESVDPAARRMFGFGLVAVGTLALLMASRWRGRRRRAILVTGGITLVIAAGVIAASGRASAPRVTADQADEICYALLRNIYHAFDYRRESDIYDVLARSTEGDLLTQIYLEVKQSLEVESQGGARVRVTDLDLRSCELVPSEEGRSGMLATECEWVAVGTVTHWGHTHDRVNRYRARLEIGPREGEWRLVGLQLQSEERMESTAKSGAAG